MEQDSQDHDELEYNTYNNDMQDDEELFRRPNDSYQNEDELDELDNKHDDKWEDEQDNMQDNKQDNV